MRISVVAVTAFLLLATVARAQGPDDPTSPAHYWPMEKGTALYFDAVNLTDGEVTRESRLTIWHAGTAAVEGRTAQRYMGLYAEVVAGEEEPYPPMAIYQVVDDSASTTVAFQFYGRDIEVEDHPYVDLAGPAVLGTTWTFSAKLPDFDADMPTPLIVDMEAEIVETGLTVEVPAGTFEGCLRTVEKGRARDDVRLTGGPHTGQSVDVVWEVERVWAPGLGSIEEVSLKKVLTLRRPVQVVVESEYRSQLVRVGSR